MPHPSWRSTFRQLAGQLGRGSRTRATVKLGRDTRLEERMAPAVLTPPVTRKVREEPPAVLRAPPMPGLAALDPALAGAVQQAWQVPAGTATAQWVFAVAEGQDPQAVAGPGAQLTSAEYIPNTYIAAFDAPRPVSGAEAGFQGAAFFYPLIEHQSVARFIPNDPLFRNQWHLRNTGQTGGVAGSDARVTGVWDNFTGAGVLIGIVDDGFEHAHPDLRPNYVAADSFDFNGGDSDPTPDSGSDSHGTAVGGVAAARGNNAIGVSGSAPNAGLAGIRLIAGAVSDATEAAALSYHRNSIDIYNNSWGPPDSGELGPIGPLALAALQSNATVGRNGLGNIYTWAAGNGGFTDDNVNYDAYANSRFVIAVGAIDHKGRKADYSEPGAAMLVTAPSDSFVAGAPGITTTDLTGAAGDSPTDYRNDFGGTSSATPLVSGVIALMLQANPNLTTRDVQHILARTARKNDAADPGWTTNAAGFRVNHKYGFGAINASAAVALAQSWTNVKALVPAQTPVVTVNRPLPEYPGTGLGIPVSSSVTLAKNVRLEHVEVVFNATHPYRGDLEVVLTAPSGTRSVLATQHFTDDGDDYTNWVFSSVRHWGELSAGQWTLTVRDKAGQDVGEFKDWQLRVYGTEIPPTVGGIETTRLTVLENRSAVVTSTLTVTDLDSPTLGGAKVRIENMAPGEDMLSFTPQGPISGAYDEVNGVLTLFGTATAAQYQATLRTVRYANQSDNPTVLTRKVAFQVTDSGGNASNFARREVGVIPVNDAPTFTAGGDVAVNEDAGPQAVEDWATGISGGPEASQFTSLEIIANDNPALFSAGPFVAPDGTLLFTTAPDASGTAAVQIRARDDGGTANGGVNVSPAQTFRILVAPVNDAPVIRDDVYTALEDGSLTIPASGVLGNDRDPEGDTLTAFKLTDPLHGALVFNSNGALTYLPNPDYNGNDSFTYRARESGAGLNSFPATVTVRVAPRNDLPTAEDDTATASDRPVTINVLDNDTDVDGDVLRVGSYTRPAFGRLTRTGNSLVYTPLVGAAGIDTFTYTLVDAAGATDTATVTVNVADTGPQVRSVRLINGAAAVDLGSLSRSVLPWANITGFEVSFSEDVTVDSDALVLTGATRGDVTLGFTYDAATRTARWSSASGLALDRYTLRLSAGGVSDGAGNPLASDWARAFAVLPGDFDGNGLVDELDVTGIEANATAGGPVHRWADIDGNGVVDAADADLARQNLGKRV